MKNKPLIAANLECHRKEKGLRGFRGSGPEPEEPGPPSCFTRAEWEAREPARQLLENILTRQVEICAAQRKALMKESIAGPSPYERAAEIALAHPDTALMQMKG